MQNVRPETSVTGRALRRLIATAAFAACGFGSHAVFAGSHDDALSAASMGDEKELVSLIQHGLDPDTVDAQGNTLLILAAREGHTAAVEALVSRRARLDYRNPAGDSALMLAVLRGHEDTARALIKAGAAVAHDGWAPLHYAAFEGRDSLIEPILAAGAEVNVPAPNKATALMLAARNGHIEVVRRLLALPQTDLNALNDAGLSADAWALQNNNTDIAELIQAERKRRGLRPPAMTITIE
ncbi:ankyrin repeat domain-containing protein [Thauera sp.]|uniref:ankyrin repeat domain-containing protein n=1 Tax=Thauera sp. TaxID=1905334 RepID=UPI002614C903|nr:ankyrin repeat domain-containing protein [Thauera sp.]MCK6409750.1 ankyrin repeat domain-containing protein [Thauera sp.]